MAIASNTNVDLDKSALEPLQAKQKALLDTVDDLRDLGVGRIVDLPQIIVVGDQSSGKSSVLEAISRVRFPVDRDVCTRFATELILRTERETRVHVRIQPDDTLDEGMKKKLRAFTQTKFRTDKLPEIIEEAKTLMNMDNKLNSYSKSILRIEISGPNVVSLTLVDLPGFYHGGTANQSSEGVEVVEELVSSYMAQEASIILAVISARNPLNMQAVVRKVKELGAQHRTVGIITKPDQLEAETPEEATYTQLIRNEEPVNKLREGMWHVLRNRSDKESGFSDDQRDDAESALLRKGIWARVPSRDKGIASLREKLSKVLYEHIKQTLPGVVENIETSIESRRKRLEKLGERRTTPKEIRTYLERIATQFSSLAANATEGNYWDSEFFGEIDSDSGSAFRKLRACIRDMHRGFAEYISSRGAQWSIEWGPALKEIGAAAEVDTLDSQGGIVEEYARIHVPRKITEAELRRMIEAWAAANIGRQFPGSPDDRLSLKVFEEQAKPWKLIAAHHIELVIGTTRAFVESLIVHVTGADVDTRNSLLQTCISPFFEEKEEVLKRKLEELLPRYSATGYTLPLEYEFQRRVNERRVCRCDESLKLLDEKHNIPQSYKPLLQNDRISQVAACQRIGEDVNLLGLDMVIDNMAVYYEVRPP